MLEGANHQLGNHNFSGFLLNPTNCIFGILWAAVKYFPFNKKNTDLATTQECVVLRRKCRFCTLLVSDAKFV